MNKQEKWQTPLEIMNIQYKYAHDYVAISKAGNQ